MASTQNRVNEIIRTRRGSVLDVVRDRLDRSADRSALRTFQSVTKNAEHLVVLSQGVPTLTDEDRQVFVAMQLATVAPSPTSELVKAVNVRHGTVRHSLSCGGWVFPMPTPSSIRTTNIDHLSASAVGWATLDDRHARGPHDCRQPQRSRRRAGREDWWLARQSIRQPSKVCFG